MQAVFASFTMDTIQSTQQLLTCVTSLFKKTTLGDDLYVLVELTPAIITWLEEPKSDINVYSNLKKQVDALWDELISSMKRCYKGSYDTDFLKQMGQLFKAAFCNKHRHIKNSMIEFWNATFGTATALEYPEYLVSVLSHIKQKANIILPNWDGPIGSHSLEVNNSR
jgi:hypothetical protein